MGGGGHAQSEPGPGHGPGNARVRRPAYVDAAAGALAGVVARFVVQPLDVLKIRFQVQVEPIGRGGAAAAAQSKYTGLRQALMSIVREEGVRVLAWSLLLAAARSLLAVHSVPRRKQCCCGVGTRECLARASWGGTLPGQLLAAPDDVVQCCSSLSHVYSVLTRTSCPAAKWPCR